MGCFDLSEMNMMPKPLMLKDYLLDDLSSSCSSNGFRSLPRRQYYCSTSPTTTTTTTTTETTVKFILQMDLKESKPTTSSAFQRASKTVMNAVKLLPFSTTVTVKSLLPSSKRIRFLSKRSFRKNQSIFVESNSPEKPVTKRISPAVTVDYDPSKQSTKAKEWLNDGDDQSSPVSVLDFPFNEDDDVSWPFRRKLSRTQGELQKLPEKFKIFNSLSKLEPVNLGKQFATMELTRELPMNCRQSSDSTRKEDTMSTETLLQVMKARFPPSVLVENLLLDLFMETGCLDEVIRVAENWIKGQTKGLFLGWEVQKNRQTYIREMENGGKWRADLEEEIEETADMIEAQILSSLLNEIVF